MVAVRGGRHGTLMATAIIAALGVAWSPAADAHPGATEELQQLDARVREDPENAALRVRYADAATRAGDLHRALTAKTAAQTP